MKMLDEVAVVCDHRTVESALALRGVLEHFRLRVRLHRLVQAGEALDFFAHAPSSPYTVLMSMATTGEESPGSGEFRDVFEGGLRFEVVELEHGDPEAEEVVYTRRWSRPFRIGWKVETRTAPTSLPGRGRSADGRPDAFVDLTPSTIPNLVTAAGGTVVAVAGQELLAQPFLAAGYDAVIAPIEPGVDDDAALLFTISFFYFAMSEDAAARDPAGPVYSDEQAVAQAAALDSAHRYGTGGYRYYKRERRSNRQ